MTRFKVDPRTGMLRRAHLWYGYLVLAGARQPLYLTRNGDLTLDRRQAHEFPDQETPMRLLRNQMRFTHWASAHVEEC